MDRAGVNVCPGGGNNARLIFTEVGAITVSTKQMISTLKCSNYTTHDIHDSTLRAVT